MSRYIDDVALIFRCRACRDTHHVWQGDQWGIERGPGGQICPQCRGSMFLDGIKIKRREIKEGE